MSHQSRAVAVMITRTGKAGQLLSTLVEEKNLSCWLNPTLKIVAEDFVLPIDDFEQVIFTSAKAVKYGIEKSSSLSKLLPDTLIAVGSGTAQRLKQAGYEDITIPDIYSSEGLLALETLKEIKGQSILIVKGIGGRQLLSEQLSKRGATCYALDVYRRVTTEIDQNQWQDFLAFNDQQGLKIITMASVDALNALVSNIGETFNYSKIVLIVASQRIAEAAKAYSFKSLVVAKSATNDAMLSAILKFVESKTIK